MSYTPQIKNKISVLNSATLTPVSAGQVFQGVGEDVSDYGRAGISIWTPFGEPTDGILTIEVSRDNVNWGGPSRVFSNTAISEPHMWNIVEKYFRIKYTQGTTSASTLQIQVQFSVNADILLGHQLDDSLIDETEAIITRSVNVAQTPDGSYTNNRQDGLAFSTTTVLTNGQTYSSGVLSLVGYTQVQTDLLSVGANGTLTIRFYQDSAGTILLRTLTSTYTSGDGFKFLSAPAFTPYVKYEFTCTSVGQTQFYFDTKFTTKSISGQIINLSDNLASGMVANLGRNVIVGQDVNGTFGNVSVTTTTNDSGSYNNLNVVNGARPSQLSGRLRVSEVVDTTVSVLQRTITAGKTFFVTDLLLTINNTDSNSSGRVNLRDGLTVAGVIILPLQIQESPQNESATITIDHTFSEPLQFSTGLFIEEGVGINSITGVLIGYEE